MHVAVTFDGTASRIYINGVLDNSISFSPATIKSNTTELQIGARQGSNRWSGDIDDLRLYARVLDAEAILALFTGEVGTVIRPVPPLLSLPQNGATGIEPSGLQLTWQQSLNASSFRIQLADNASFNSPVLDQSGINGNSYQVSGLLAETTYFWRVLASNVAGESEWSQVWSFTTASGVTPPVDENLIGHWKMDEGSGNRLLDSSGNGNDATFVSSSSGVTWVQGQNNLAVRTNGALNRYAAVPHNASLDITQEITVSAWIRPNTVGRRQILSKGGPDGFELGTFESGKIEFRINRESNGTAYRLFSVVDYPSDGNTWMHVAVTFDGAASRIYINGVPDNSISFAPATIKTNTTELQIGARQGSNRWSGDIDDLRLYSRALSASEVLNLTNTGGAFRTIENPVIKGESDDSSENPSLLEKNTQERDRPGVTRMFPNPVSDLINLELSNLKEDRVQVSIFDMKGIVLLDQEFESENGTLVLDISKLRLKPGTHVLLVNTNGSQQVFKFLKK
jgi:hypothetical protein